MYRVMPNGHKLFYAPMPLKHDVPRNRAERRAAEQKLRRENRALFRLGMRLLKGQKP